MNTEQCESVSPRSAIWRKLIDDWREMAANANREGPIPGDEIGHAARWTAVEMCADEADTALRACAEAPAPKEGEVMDDDQSRSETPEISQPLQSSAPTDGGVSALVPKLRDALIASHALLNKRSIEWLGSAPMEKTPEYLAWMEERRAVLVHIGEALRLDTENPACNQCGGPHPFDTSIPSPTWNAVVRAANLPEYLCLPCIVKAFAAAHESFTATLWGGPFDGDEIEVTIGGALIQDVELLSLENNELRTKLHELRAEAPATDKGAVVLSAEDARSLAFLIARAIREDDEASEGDRREARTLLAKLGGDTQ